MNNYEATRYVHKLIADVLANEFAHVSASDYPWSAGKDAPKLRRVLDHWIELHRRRGPLAADRAPREVEYRGERLPLEGEDADTAAETPTARSEQPGVGAVAACADGGRDDERAAHDGVASDRESGEGSVCVEATRNAAGQVIARPNVTDAGQHYMMPPPRGDREPMRLTFADDIDEALQPLATFFASGGVTADEASEGVARANAALAAATCDALRVSALGVFACTLPKFHADSMNATPHEWQELDTCSARRMHDDGMWRCIKHNGHVDEHEWRKEQP